MAQSPVVLAGSSERRAGGGFSSTTVAKAYPESGKWVWISLFQANPELLEVISFCCAGLERGWGLAVQSDRWVFASWLLLQHCCFIRWPLHPKCMLIRG